MVSRKVRLVCCCLLLILAYVPALGEHRSFTESQPLPEFPADYLVSSQAAAEETLTLTLAGDCTLGGTESANHQENGLTRTVLRKGFGYPFSGLLPLFSSDDLTLVNLEGVLSDDSRGENKEKEFAFRGPSSLAQALALGSVEAVNLANNHSGDYGAGGRADTLTALEEQGIAYAGGEWLCVFRSKTGCKVGLAGITGTLNKGKRELIARQISLLKEAGCQIIVYSLHAGQEYDERHNTSQQEMARYLIDAGADVVAGHHPHVVQGIEIYKDRLILYSLGNCVFGGNAHPKEAGALAVRVVCSLAAGTLKSMQASLYPIAITGKARGNDYRPVLLTGKPAQAVLKQVQADTAFLLSPYRLGEGSPLPLLTVK